jgi:hypothetical protein
MERQEGAKALASALKIESLIPLLTIREAYFKLARQTETIHFRTLIKLCLSAFRPLFLATVVLVSHTHLRYF